MKIAALILAHTNKDQIVRLISALNHSSIDIFIHLDKKSTLSPCDFNYPNVYFTQKRIDIALFEFSMIDAQMELIYTALSHGDYGYFILLSGQCYPLRHIDNIYSYLCRNYPTPFIEVISPEIATKFSSQFSRPYALKRFRNAYLPFIQKYLPASSIIPYRYVPALIVRMATLIKGLFVKSPEKALKQMGIKPYFGPQWWILPDTAIAAILPLYESDTFRNCMKNCYSCDETFFQTAIMVHADQFGITLNEKGYYLNKKWFTIFSGGHPIILTLDNFEQIISSQMLFGRKFNITKDSAILDRLDAYNSIHRSEEILD